MALAEGEVEVLGVGGGPALEQVEVALAAAADQVVPCLNPACEQGAWQGSECNGRLVAAQRYRFRALKAHNEVLFWTVGGTGPSGKYTECVINDGRNWQCKPNADARLTITHQMAHGEPVQNARVHELGYHQVQKWKWQLLSLGMPAGRSAMN